jgi:hypothetical protein
MRAASNKFPVMEIREELYNNESYRNITNR